ncbi:MAG: hypothetical protein PHU64_06975 [Candidatus Omnitrophica bacterium]|nr:hypothetical protein [Candidatus Omnitrophota bacterium]MDD5430483.1 hypothetical protein [Candidatus Omnitrophota bacterium]
MRNVSFFLIGIAVSCLICPVFAASEVQEFWVNESQPILPGDTMCRCLIKHYGGEVDGKPVSYYGEYTLTYSEFDGKQIHAVLKKQVLGAKDDIGEDNSSVSMENRSCSVGSGKTHCFISIIQGVNLNVRIVDDQGGISVQK